MRRLTQADFKTMPWKNGGGTTLELLHLTDTEDDTLLRLSRASVRREGPFSFFPGLERTLLVLAGEGLQLDMSGDLIELRQNDEPLKFAGELAIHCDLIEGPVEDFNVMIDRNYGSAVTQLHTGPVTFIAGPATYVYIPERQELWVTEKDDVWVELKDGERGIEVRVSGADPHEED